MCDSFAPILHIWCEKAFCLVVFLPIIILAVDTPLCVEVSFVCLVQAFTIIIVVGRNFQNKEEKRRHR